MSKWVQHISGQGEKWEVAHEYADVWLVRFYKSDHVPDHISLPKSEYHEVPAPEVWKDVTAECGYAPPRCGGLSSGMSRIYHEGHTSTVCEIYTQYKMTKVQIGERWAFIIERKEGR